MVLPSRYYKYTTYSPHLQVLLRKFSRKGQRNKKPPTQVGKEVFVKSEGRSARDTGTFDTLNDVTLTKQVQDDQGNQDQDTTRVTNSRGVERLTGIVRIQRLGDLDDVGQQDVAGGGVEQFGVEVVGPLPAEGEHEYRDHHSHRQRNDDAEEGTEHAGTIQVSRFFQFVRDALEELPHQEDEQTVLEAQTCERQDVQGCVGVDQVDAGGG